jgi:hypothetical protein
VSSIKLPSPVPTPPVSAPPGRSRLSRYAIPDEELEDIDAEGEDDVEEGVEEVEGDEDKKPYCFCQKMSYGEVSVVFYDRKEILKRVDDSMRQRRLPIPMVPFTMR